MRPAAGYLFRWTPERTSELLALDAAGQNSSQIADTLSRRWGMTINSHMVLGRIRRLRKGAGAQGIGLERDVRAVREAAPTQAPVAPARDTSETLLRLARRKDGVSLDELADALDVSPKRARDALDEAKAAGYSLDEAHGRVHVRSAEPTRVPVAIGEPAREAVVGIISDMHAGSRYHLGDEMADHIRACYAAGAREILCSGDLTEGCYRHARWELSEQGMDDQIAKLLSGLPELPGLNVRLISGNHDQTWEDATGLDAGRAIVRAARDRGRNDLHYYGAREGNLIVHGTKITLWHPKRGLGYAKTYGLQNWIRDRHAENKPDLVIAGHWHQAVYFEQASTKGLAAGCFQHGDSPFGRSLGGDVAIGGWLLRWERDEAGGFRRFVPEFRAYNARRVGFRSVA